jgi:predicted RNase H-like HicB family nuclease
MGESIMQYAILLQHRPDGKYEAHVPLVPGLTRTGDTKKETLAKIREAIVATMSQTELVYLDVPLAATPENPWLATAGLFANDETLEPMLQEIYAARAAE